METDAPALSLLEKLATSADIRDRAFAASELRRRLRVENRDQLALVYECIRETARSQHAEVRGRIQAGTLDTGSFVADLRRAPLEIRDHLVEEILDVAYPPLEESSLRGEVVLDASSGLAEILFTIEEADLDGEKTFVDLGSGSGKVVLLIALLSGARAYGVELDTHLVAHARRAASALNLDNATFIEGDIRDGSIPAGDVYYMYIPFVRSAEIATRLAAFAAERNILLFSQALDLTRLPWLRARHAASYWLETYEANRGTG